MEIKAIRQAIDHVDEQITELFCQRMRLAAEIAVAKQRENIPLVNEAREQEIITKACGQAGPELAPYTQELYSTLFRLSKDYQQQPNIVLIGMPGCGKSTIGLALARLTSRTLFDTDDMVIETAGIGIPDIFEKHGEATFRRLEQEAVEIAAQSRCSIIATGGGTVLSEENCRLLGEKGLFFFIERDLDKLPVLGRPLSLDLPTLYQQRLPIYQSLAFAVIDNNSTIDQAAHAILHTKRRLQK